jgi:hypothetical protein
MYILQESLVCFLLLNFFVALTAFFDFSVVVGFSLTKSSLSSSMVQEGVPVPQRFLSFYMVAVCFRNGM